MVNTSPLCNRVKKEEKGVALLMVMIALLVFMVVTVEFAYSTRVHYMTALNLRDRLQSEYLARSGIQLSLLVLRFQKQLDQVQSRVENATLVAQGPIYKQIPIDTRLLKMAVSGAALPLPDGEEASVTTTSVDVGMSEIEKRKLANFLDLPGDFFSVIDDEGGKINLNALANITLPQAASPGGSPTPTPPPSPQQGAGEPLTIAQMTVNQLVGLFSGEKYESLFQDRYSKEEIIYNIMDWVDADQDRANGSGNEGAVYAQYGSDFTVKNAKFDSIDEVALVEGVDQRLLDTFRSALTVYGPDQKININTAPTIVLEGVVRSLLKLQGQEEIDQIVEWLDENRNFKDQSTFLTGIETRFGYQTADMDQSMLSSLTFKSSLFSVVSTGVVGAESAEGPPIQTTIRMVVAQSSNQNTGETPSFPAGFRVVYWRIE